MYPDRKPTTSPATSPANNERVDAQHRRPLLRVEDQPHAPGVRVRRQQALRERLAALALEPTLDLEPPPDAENDEDAGDHADDDKPQTLTDRLRHLTLAEQVRTAKSSNPVFQVVPDAPAPSSQGVLMFTPAS